MRTHSEKVGSYDTSRAPKSAPALEKVIGTAAEEKKYEHTMVLFHSHYETMCVFWPTVVHVTTK